MRPHHTKDKGDIGVAHAIADLVDQGFVVLTTICEHAPLISLCTAMAHSPVCR